MAPPAVAIALYLLIGFLFNMISAQLLSRGLGAVWGPYEFRNEHDDDMLVAWLTLWPFLLGFVVYSLIRSVGRGVREIARRARAR